MGFKEVQSLDAETTIALGKINKETGKSYPKQAEGYFLGTREVENKRGKSKLHFLQTPKGNLGIWGTTDLDRKLGATTPGTMVRVTSTGTKKTPNGEMYTYRVEVDSDNTIPLASLFDKTEPTDAPDENVGGDDGQEEDSNSDEYDEGMQSPSASSMAASAAARAAKVQALLTKNKR